MVAPLVQQPTLILYLRAPSADRSALPLDELVFSSLTPASLLAPALHALLERRFLLISGPTRYGKTSLALAIALWLANYLHKYAFSYFFPSFYCSSVFTDADE